MWLERMCDVAGAELLLPRRLFLPRLAEGDFDLATVEDLSGAFEASIEACALRAVMLHREPAMMLVLSLRHKPTEAGREEEVPPRLRLDYGVGQGSWPYPLKHKSADDDGLGRILQGEILDGRVCIDEMFANAVGDVRISARPYGRKGRVIALVTRAV